MWAIAVKMELGEFLFGQSNLRRPSPGCMGLVCVFLGCTKCLSENGVVARERQCPARTSRSERTVFLPRESLLKLALNDLCDDD